MTQYMIMLDAHAMDDFPAEDMPEVARAAHAATREAIAAGVWVCGGGLEEQRATVVAVDGTVTEGPEVTIGGVTVIDVPSREEALKWAAKFTHACRSPQEVWEVGYDPQIDAMLREAAGRR